METRIPSTNDQHRDEHTFVVHELRDSRQTRVASEYFGFRGSTDAFVESQTREMKGLHFLTRFMFPRATWLTKGTVDEEAGESNLRCYEYDLFVIRMGVTKYVL